MTATDERGKSRAYVLCLARPVIENVLWVILLVTLLIKCHEGWSQSYATGFAVASLVYTVYMLFALGSRIKDVSRIPPDKIRNLAAFLLALILTELIWSVGVIGGSLLRDDGWSLPIGDIISPGVIIGTLLGVATLFALVITFVEVKEHSRPQAMGFREALDAVSDFMDEYSGKKKASFLLCSYYPCIGAVNQGEYQEAYDKFCENLRTHKVECICLSTNTVYVNNGEDLKRLAENVSGKRPTSVAHAVGAFAHMWKAQGGADSDVDTKKFGVAIKNITKEVRWQVDSTPPLVQFVSSVPDFHFMLALRSKKHVLAGFVLLPLRPAGMPSPQDLSLHTPPMLGVEVHDHEILEHLKDLHDDLRSTFQSEEVTDPPHAKL